MMSKVFVYVLMILLLFLSFNQRSYALSDTQADSIQKLLDDASAISGVPGMSLSVIVEEDVFYFSSGFADRETGMSASENTLYELASVSKAFTGAGILLLEEQGLLSMSDPITNYLPWFTLVYQGEMVDKRELTLNNFLHHTSGLTNPKHTKNIPQGNGSHLLRKTVEMLVGEELAFPPGERYEYGTVNYDVLGLVIQQVSGQSYEEFMEKQLFRPLGLYHTYVCKKEAKAAGQLAQGYRSSFFLTSPYDAPEYDGNKPAGYLISSAKDMARWMRIQLGEIDDLPEEYQTVVERSQQGNQSVSAVGNRYYAGGWLVNADQTIIEHSGGNPNFRTEVILLPYERTAVCLLTNGANTNGNVVKKMTEILKGDLNQTYNISGTQTLDRILSSLTLLFCLLALLFLFLGFRIRSRTKGRKLSKKRLMVIFCLLTVAFVIVSIMAIIGKDWFTIVVWETYSIVTVLISSSFLLITVAWYIFVRR